VGFCRRVAFENNGKQGVREEQRVPDHDIRVSDEGKNGSNNEKYSSDDGENASDDERCFPAVDEWDFRDGEDPFITHRISKG
jgi:hypothetical protein